MSEAGGHNLEIAHHLTEAGEHAHAESRTHQMIEVVQAIILAMVAVTTAWSGYQAARWGSVQSLLYGRSSRLRVEGQALDVEANQVKQYDAATVVEWMKAAAQHDMKLADFFERRLLPEFRPAFEAWKKTDPLNNPNAPAGPTLMPQYHNSKGEEAEKKDIEASALFEEGTRAREVADAYIRATVGLATVLFLTAMSQRFKSVRIRTMLVAFAFVLLCIPLWHILALPRT